MPHQDIATLAPRHDGRAPYRTPRLERFGTFREITRQGFSGNVDGGLILGPDGSATPAADDVVIGGSR